MITGMGWEEMNVGSFPFPNQNRMMRNTSSLSRESSEFEFVSRSFADNSDEEGPVSPKLLNFCGNWDGWAEPFMISGTSGTTTASVDHESDIIVNGEQHGDYNSARALSEDTSTPNHGKDQPIQDNQNQNVLHSERRNNIEGGHIHEIKVRTSLGSLLDRRDFEHLPALTAYSKQIMSHKQPAAIHDSPAWSWTTSTSSSSSSSSAVSPSSTPGDRNNRPSSYISKDEMGQYANYFNYQGSGEAAADCCLSNQKKPIRSKWPAVIKLDFLRKTVPLRSEEHGAAAKSRFIRNQETNQPLDYASYVAPRRVSFESSRESTCSSINSNSTSTANSPVHLHGYGRDDQAIRGYKSAPVSPPQYIVRTSPGSPYSPADAAAARGSARGHGSGNEYPCSNERTIVLRRRSADYLGTAQTSCYARNITDQAAMASSRISETSSNDPERRRAKVQARSPHHKTSMAGHYVEKQRGRAEEVKRRTPLPYRQSSLFGASCFFPAHNSHHHQLRHTR